jgi:soluble epoxide hydrolase / lipid-phosphate phosphatase
VTETQSIFNMATIAFPDHSKTVKLSSSTTYTYVNIPARGSNPTLLLLHGFPSSSYDWRHQIEYFPTKGFGVLAPDLLGYGGTDRPSSLSGYNGKRMASDLVELLELEKIENIHLVGHDWGCFPASRLANYYPKRFLTVTFLDIPYRPPGQTFDLNAVNKITRDTMGFERFGYWYFFDKEEAGKLCAENVSMKYNVKIFELTT